MSRGFISKEILRHKLMLGAFAVVGVIALGSGTYYFLESRPPAAVALPQTQDNNPAQAIVTNGTVEPAQNPDLSFEESGRIASVRAVVGQQVTQGQVLAALDTAALMAQLEQAQADARAASAKLDEMKSGPRDVDVAVKRTAVSQANQQLNASYTSLFASMSDAQSDAYGAVYTQTNTLFNNPNTPTPTLVFQSNDSQLSQTAVGDRLAAAGEVDAWNKELTSLSADPTHAQLDTALGNALRHLSVVRVYENDLVRALNNAVPSSSFPAASITSALASVTASRDHVSSLILSLTNNKQTLASGELAVESAQSNLDQALAGATTQDLAVQQAAVDRAQASVKSIEAQIGKELIVAPFSGTVSSVGVKAGEIATPNTPAITLLPSGAFQVVVYVTELEVGNIALGDQAHVTLDAYGATQTFAASVAVVDQSPSQTGSGSAYKVTLVFAKVDPRVRAGMTANAYIYPGTHSATSNEQ